DWGGIRTCSVRLRMSSTELLEAASSSWILNEFPLLKARQDAQVPQASFSAVMFSQLIVFARIRAQVVLPTPRGPQNKKACASWLFLMACFSVLVICCWPTTRSHVAGLYFLAD